MQAAVFEILVRIDPASKMEKTGWAGLLFARLQNPLNEVATRDECGRWGAHKRNARSDQCGREFLSNILYVSHIKNLI
jgi:hypothetical protein